MKLVFGKGKTVKTSRPRPPKTLKQVLHEAWIKELRRNPGLLRRVSAKEAGHLDLLEEPDEDSIKTQSLEEELRQAITTAALEKIQENPNLLDDAVKKRIGQMVGDRRKEGSALEEVLNSFTTLEEFRQRFGEAQDNRLITPQVIDTAIKNLGPILTSILTSHSPTSKIYVVETPQGVQEMGPEAYKNFLGEKAQSRLPAPTSSPTSLPETPPETSSRSPQPQASPTSTLDLGEWITYLSKDPSEFAQVLRTRAEENSQIGESARFAISLLMANTADQILALIRPFKERPNLSDTIAKIESRRDWLELLIAQFQVT